MNAGANTNEIVAALKASKKYGAIAEPALERIAAWAGARHANTKAAIKAAKRKLHQVHGAYFDGRRLPEIDAALAGIEAAASDEELRRHCELVLRLHPSTAERMPIVADFYATVFEATGAPQRLLDIGCGLNPFALPWMGLRADCHYTALDLDARLLERVDRLLTALNQPHTVAAMDALGELPAIEADTVLLLKIGPCIERQEQGAFKRLLAACRSSNVVVSFPSVSLGGRDVGMREHYRAFMESLGQHGRLRCFEFEAELAYLSETA